MDELYAILKLISIPGLGPRKILPLKKKKKKASDVLNASMKELCSIDGINQKVAIKIKKIESLGESDEISRTIEMIEKKKIKFVTIFDNNYPENLKTIYDPPPIVFYWGEFRDSDYDSIAIVGTRSPSQYGKNVTEVVARELVKAGITTVSGFARGVDTIVHKTTLRAGGRTIAVLGNGLDIIYPPENKKLMNMIIECGVYCSEFLPGTKPDAVNFPRRNRIISGLSLGVLVIEAGEKSGALITAYYATDQNREVFALPGRITDKKSVGTNNLIKQGAKLISSAEDVLEEIDRIRKYPRRSHQMELTFKLEGEERKIYDIINHEPVHIENLAELVEMQPYEILPTLLSLELKGLVKQLPGKYFVKIS